MQEPTQEEKNQAMENIECWKTQEHLKECRKCAPVGNWLQIEDEFRKKFVKLQDVTKFNDERCSYDYVPSKRDFKILAFFKPYFQELEEKAWMYDQLNK